MGDTWSAWLSGASLVLLSVFATAGLRRLNAIRDTLNGQSGQIRDIMTRREERAKYVDHQIEQGKVDLATVATELRRDVKWLQEESERARERVHQMPGQFQAELHRLDLQVALLRQALERAGSAP